MLIEDRRRDKARRESSQQLVIFSYRYTWLEMRYIASQYSALSEPEETKTEKQTRTPKGPFSKLRYSKIR